MQRRLDNGMYTQPIWFGLIISGIYILFTPQVIFSIPNWFENLLGAAIAIGGGVCLWGSLIKDWRTAYRWEIGGLALIIVVLGVLAIATNLTLLEQFTLGGGLGALVQIGSMKMIVSLWLALHRGPAGTA